MRRLCLLFLICFVSFTVAAAQTEHGPSPRIRAAIDNDLRVSLHGQVHRLALPEFDQGAVPPDLPLHKVVLMLQGSPEQQKSLDQFLIDLQDKSSPEFHHWLTPDEFGRRFGVADADIQTIQSWLVSQGFTVNGVAHNRRMIEFSGTAGQLASAFHTEIHRYSIAGAEHIANAVDPSIPVAFDGVVSGFLSLNDFRHRPTMTLRDNSAILWPFTREHPLYDTPGGHHALSPADFALIYDVNPVYQSGIDGTGQAIAVPSRSDFNTYDTVSFRSYFNLPIQSPTVLYNGQNPGQVSSSDIGEVELDLEWSGAIAPQAHQFAVVSADTNTTDGIDLSNIYAVDNNVAPILSVSYGFCEQDWPAGVSKYTSIWQQAAAQGISVLIASGDNGSAACDDPSKPTTSRGLAVSGLASSPDVVAVGGTQFNDVGQDSTYWSTTNGTNNVSVLSYIPEIVWNESNANGLAASSGGVSTIYSTPAWQTGKGVPAADPGNPTGHHRYLPDVSLAAASHDGYWTCLPDGCNFIVSGTSASVQAFAGIMALIDQKAGGPQGNPNFHLYPLSTVSGVYHDVTSGSNAVACTPGTLNCVAGSLSGYSAGPGYDLATGWGSVDVNALVTHWGDITFQPTTVTGTANPTTFQHGASINLSASVSGGSGAPKGAIAAYVVNGNQTVGLGAADIASGTVFTPTNQVPGGSPVLYFRYGGDGVNGASVSSGTTLTVTPEPTTVSATPSSTSMPWGSLFPMQFTVVGTSGVGTPTGKVTVSENGSVLGTASVGATPIFIGTGPTGAGTFTFTTTYSGDNNFAPSSTNTDITLTKANPQTYFSCQIYNAQVVTGTPIYCGWGIGALQGGPAPKGTVQFYDGTTPVSDPFPTYPSSSTLPDLSKLLAVGPHVLSIQYQGDANYNSYTSNNYAFTIVPTGTVKFQFQGFQLALPGGVLNFSVGVLQQQQGPPLTGTVAIYDGTTMIASSGLQNGVLATFYSFNSPTQPWSLGTHNITAVYSGDPVWQQATSDVWPIKISNPDVYLTGIMPVTVTRGMPGGLGISVNQLGITDNGPVTLSCSGAPAESTCAFQFPQVNANSGYDFLAITTTAPHVVSGSLRKTTAWLFLAVLPFGFVIVGPLRQRTRSILFLIALSLVMFSLVSCGGGGGSGITGGGGPGGGGSTDPGTPVGTYTLTVTSTYGSGTNAITHTYSVPLTVQ